MKILERDDTQLPAQASSEYDYETLLASRQRHFLPLALYHDKPLNLVRAEGMYMWDADGNRYLDCIGGIICISAGHHHPKIKQKLIGMLENNEPQHVSTLYLNEHPVRLAETLVEEAPDGLDRVSFTNSGSEANELAFMTARQATGETMIINLRHSYHGGTAATQAQCGHATWRFRAQPVTATTSALEPYCYRCPFNKKPDSCDFECAQNVETTIQTSTHGRIAAMIVEPVMGVGGFISPPKEYFDRVTSIVHEYGGKYISDEVQTGAGRCGQEFLLTRELDIDADMVTMAKGFGNGAAIGAVLMKSEDADSLKGKLYFNTFGADPYPVAQAQATMDIIKEEGLINNAREMGARIVDGLNEMAKRHHWIGDVRGRGLLLGMEMVRDRKTKEHAVAEAARFMDLCKDRKVLLGKGGLKGNVIRIAPPLTINAQQVDQLLEVMDQSLAEL
ncbi:MAG: aspartate aminotransferase family protein [Xanthomonadales bacterium]|nr:aspartate aminotransferase family protein [Gammaproteobacteria bacterium]NNE04842.1 aspartate aminotransferase family protein [Xanthomonadales bacterium]NNL95085.1 aspartate aminotransferase family protein [Xanthomonadales bacterium]